MAKHPHAAMLATLDADRLATAAHLAHVDDAIAALRALAGDVPPPAGRRAAKIAKGQEGE